jgi:hypothetical protein
MQEKIGEEMKIEINPEKNSGVQTTAVDAVEAIPAESGMAVKKNPSGLTRDIWDKRNLMNSLKDVWDSEDTATISEAAKRGIVGDPRIVGEEK